MNKTKNILLSLGLLFSMVFAFSDVALAKKSSHKSKKTNTKLVRNKKKAKAVNINTADAKTLSEIKGIGIKTAKAIVNYRNKNGKFKYYEDLLDVKCNAMSSNWLNRFRKNLTI